MEVSLPDRVAAAATITDRHASGTPRCMNSLDFISCVLLTVLFGANRIRYRRGTLAPLTPRGQPYVVQGVWIQTGQSVVLGNRYPAMVFLLIGMKIDPGQPMRVSLVGHDQREKKKWSLVIHPRRECKFNATFEGDGSTFA